MSFRDSASPSVSSMEVGVLRDGFNMLTAQEQSFTKVSAHQIKVVGF
jgi:hypothetical protein